LIGDDMGWYMINQECGCKVFLIPKFKRHACFRKKGQAYIHNMAVIMFCRAILLMCMEARHTIGDAYTSEEQI
jgi:hypothetical protein